MAEEESVSMKVKLKVHYTFDTEHKVDCLSRPSESYDVDTVALEDGTSIGIIDLRTCLQAVTSSSPELTHFHESDYTVYAYDYSEVNTPLVGQGMLSKVLMQESASTEAMITGKVTKSLMAKLKKNVEPFLEVKLRLTPITSAFQRGRSGSTSSVADNGQSQWSSFSQVAPGASDRPQSPADLSRLENMQRTLHEGGPRRDSLHNNSYPWGMNPHPSSRPATPTQFAQYLPPQPSSTHSRHAAQNFTFQNYHVRRGSESGYGSGDDMFEDGPARKRAKITRVQQTKKASFNIEQQPSSLRTAAMGASSLRVHQPTPINPAAALQRGLSIEEPVRPPTPVPKPKPAKKSTGRGRGRPPKNRTMENAEPSSPGPNDNAQQQLPDSNMSSPEATRHPQPNESVMSTPMDIPSSPPQLPSARLGATSPELPDNSTNVDKAKTNHDSGYFSGQPDSGDAETNGHTKNDTTANDDDIFGDLDPTAFGEHDLAWLNGAFDSHMMNMDMDSGLREQGAENHFTPVFDDESTCGGPTPQPGPTPVASYGLCPNPEPENRSHTEPSPVPQTIPTPTLQTKAQSQPPLLPRQTSNTQNQFQRPILPASHSSVQSTSRPVPNLLPRPPGAAFHRSQSVLPAIPASDPGFRQFQRSNTWAPDAMSDVAMSDAPGPGDTKSKARKRVGKEQTQARLENAIAMGGMPPYCNHCGSIETPAWRRGYIKNFTCPFDSVPISLESGGMIYKEVIESNPNGTVKLWRGWKVEKLPGQIDSDWEQINLCNPCGLFLHKNKRPRPAEKWQKKDKSTAEKRKRKRPPKPPKSRTNPPRAAAGNLPSEIQSEAPEPPSEDSSPADTSMEDGNDDANDTGTVNGDSNDSSQEPELPPMPRNVMSAQPHRRTVKWADTQPRQAQSSPVIRGTADEPIDVDLTPKPLRRRLFSPSGNEMYGVYAATAVLSENKNISLLPSFVRRSPRLNKTKDVFESDVLADSMTAPDGKENMAPAQDFDDDPDFNEIFGGDGDDFMIPPATPTPKRRSERILLRTPGKTPTRDFGIEISGNGQAVNKTPKDTARLNLTELMMGSALRSMDPKQMTPHTRALFHACSDVQTPHSKHSRGRTGFTPKATTPGRSSINFDFPDLPSLKPSSPMSHDENGHAFSELPTDRLYSNLDDILDTDAQMPSSPPVNGWNHDDFGDMVDFQAFENTNWDFIEEHAEDTTKPRTPGKQKSKDFLNVETPGRAGLRRSPRRAGRD